MTHVSDVFLQHASSKHQDDNCVVLIGYGKNYEHLMDINRLYASELDQLLISWRRTSLIQVLKSSYHDSLVELAKASGHKGETLTSLNQF